MSARPAKEAEREAPPTDFAAGNPPAYRGTTSGYDFYLQSICEIQKSVGSIESSIKHLSERTQVHETKLDEIEKDVHGAKRVVWVFGILGSIIGAIGLVLLNKLLDLAVSYFSAKLPTH
jgi:hypothetical protein